MRELPKCRLSSGFPLERALCLRCTQAHLELLLLDQHTRRNGGHPGASQSWRLRVASVDPTHSHYCGGVTFDAASKVGINRAQCEDCDTEELEGCVEAGAAVFHGGDFDAGGCCASSSSTVALATPGRNSHTPMPRLAIVRAGILRTPSLSPRPRQRVYITTFRNDSSTSTC